MIHRAAQQKELERVDSLTITQAVAYANRLVSRLESNDCSDEERKNGLELLRRLTERVRFLKITLEPIFSRTG
jgi:tellurite resistance protein